jgi:hypothetical protein
VFIASHPLMEKAKIFDLSGNTYSAVDLYRSGTGKSLPAKKAISDRRLINQGRLTSDEKRIFLQDFGLIMGLVGHSIIIPIIINHRYTGKYSFIAAIIFIY